MSVRMRHTRAHTNNRRSHHALTAVKIVRDVKSGALRLPHRLDETTGLYRGRQIAPVKAERAKVPTRKGPSAEPAAPRMHDHAHDHGNAEAKAAAAGKGFFGKFSAAGRPKARSGAGGGGA